jgi:hypothetical protein
MKYVESIFSSCGGIDIVGMVAQMLAAWRNELVGEEAMYTNPDGASTVLLSALLIGGGASSKYIR